MPHLPRPLRWIATLLALAAVVAAGVSIGLLGGAAASAPLERAVRPQQVPSRARLHAAAAALARKPVPKPAPDTLVARSRHETIALYRRRGGRPYRQLGPLPFSYGTKPVFRVLADRGTWLRVSLPVRPNRSTAWIRRRDVNVASTDYRLEVQLRRHRLVLHRGRRVVLRAKVAVGKALTPTPAGTYFVVYALRTGDPHGFFGPYALGTSAYSNVLTTFAGGDGEVGLHGTSEPWLLGRSVSHGCIRIANGVITRLVHLVPLGTPLVIER